MPEYIDQTGRTVSIPNNPNRIISLVPSQTELLYTLGLNEKVIGITKFCIHPDSWHKNKTKVGGTKNIKHDIIAGLNPDLIIANKEENVKEQIEALQDKYPVWVSDVNTLENACEMIEQLGILVDKQSVAENLSNTIKSRFASLNLNNPKIKTAYLIWKDPYMTIGGDTFINSILEIAGFDNVFKQQLRYPEINLDDLQKANCSLVLLSSEPYPFKEKHIKALRQKLPDAKILLVDGEMFSWYGSRLIHVPEYLSELKKSIY